MVWIILLISNSSIIFLKLFEFIPSTTTIDILVTLVYNNYF